MRLTLLMITILALSCPFNALAESPPPPESAPEVPLLCLNLEPTPEHPDGRVVPCEDINPTDPNNPEGHTLGCLVILIDGKWKYYPCE